MTYYLAIDTASCLGHTAFPSNVALRGGVRRSAPLLSTVGSMISGGMLDHQTRKSQCAAESKPSALRVPLP
jgi:hypothetical protein